MVQELKTRVQGCKVHEPKASVLLWGPSLSGNTKGYGGGVGGISSALALVTEEFRGSDIEITYISYGVRSFHHLWWLLMPVRLLTDIGSLIAMFRRGSVVHIAANSGPAMVRSLVAVLVCKLVGKQVLLDVRGSGLDAFADHTCGFLPHQGWRLIIACSDHVLVQRKATAHDLSARYPGKVFHQPNMIPDSDIAPGKRGILDSKVIRAIFVGYCYRDKGVIDIVEGCLLACGRGLDIDVAFIGQESEEFSEYLNSLGACERLSIRRLGKRPRAEVLSAMRESDVFLFPTYHKGEGHPNVINEAMANELTVITTDRGAIGEVLDRETAYFVEPRSPAQLADMLCHVDSNRSEARDKARKAKQALISNYSASQVLVRLRQTYIELAERAVS